MTQSLLNDIFAGSLLLIKCTRYYVVPDMIVYSFSFGKTLKVRKLMIVHLVTFAEKK